jgi:DNA repair protein RecN (Recombination protein N)
MRAHFPLGGGGISHNAIIVYAIFKGAIPDPRKMGTGGLAPFPGRHMLKELRIRNLAIIDDLFVRFGRGLNVLTGETGAGKSIIVDALGLALGDRAQAEMIKSGEKEGSVQAYFELDDYSQLPDLGIDMSEGILLRRVISSAGKNKAYINDTMVTLQALAKVGRALVDIHSQHEHQSLLSQEKQRLLLDSYGKLRDYVQQVGTLFAERKVFSDALKELQETVQERARRLDVLRFQIDEIDAASLRPGEKEGLEEERKILANMTRLKELTEMTYSLLYDEEGSCAEKLSAALSHLREICSIDRGIEDTLNLVEAAAPMLEDATFSLRRYRDKYDFEPDRLEAVGDRLEAIKKLEKKYGTGIEEILRFRDEAEGELKKIESTDERLAEAAKELADKEAELLAAARSLSEKRKKAAAEMGVLIMRNLSELAFGSAEFVIDVRQERPSDGGLSVGPNGIDRIEFLFSANRGEPPKPLSKIASGGELSRVMLALKTVLADLDSIPVLIFDEVDAGIGGKTAGSVGKKLGVISERRQLLCITHLPQIASRGDVHLRIEKKQKADSVRVEVKELSGKERQDEIARMLSGSITEISLRHAGELLERVK